MIEAGAETAETGSDGRRYWIWVTGPDYYLDENGTDRPELDPTWGSTPDDWWTCHKETREGDLILLYRSQIKKDIAYLIEARSDAYALRNGDVAADLGWDVACDYEVIEKFRRPLQLADMRSDPVLADWGPLRANLRRRAYEIPRPIWDHLLGRLSPDHTATDRLREKATQRHLLEYDIENYLAGHMELFSRYDLHVDLHARQYVCYNGGRADLICFERSKKRFIAIELKKGMVDRNAVGQVFSYRASLEDEFTSYRQPLGILIGDSIKKEAAAMVNRDSRLSFIPLDELLSS
ncbi:EVE domain-containing protein [Protofrankia coriariae]|uniref:EVE domain-containing protein n=1 Tax=Protofrankia coriariae TaxID=1562887 RepID=A0ABR5EZE4_9ACTN|nr:EVE domain-containing protein [Protofrankia coriariae]KLL09834.1 hypothetical protein FrCorBMG51_22060 [Protofrankia coriariae]